MTTFKVGISSIEAVQGQYNITAEKWAQKIKDEMKQYIKENGNDDEIEKLSEWNLKLVKSTEIKARPWQYDIPSIHKQYGYKPDRKMLEKLSNDGLNEMLLKASQKCITKWQSEINNITHVITHTATAWQLPSIAHVLIHELNLSSTTRAIPLNGAGCQGAQTVFYTAKSIIHQEPNAIVLCCVGDIFCTSAPTIFQYRSVQQLKNKENWISLNLMSDGAVSFILQNVDINNKDNIEKYYIDKMGSFILPKSIWDYNNIAVTKELNDGPSWVGFVGKELVNKMNIAFSTYFKSWYCDVMRIKDVNNNEEITKSLINTSMAMHAGGKLIFRAIERVLHDDIQLNKDEINELLKYSVDRYKSCGNFGCASFVHALYDIINDKNNTKDIFCLAFGAGIAYQYSSIKKVTQNSAKNSINYTVKITLIFVCALAVIIAIVYNNI